jgi:hypothetical protein
MGCPGIVTRFVATEHNRGINCPTGCSIFGPHEIISEREFQEIEEREKARDQKPVQDPNNSERFVIKN